MQTLKVVVWFCVFGLGLHEWLCVCLGSILAYMSSVLNNQVLGVCYLVCALAFSASTVILVKYQDSPHAATHETEFRPPAQ